MKPKPKHKSKQKDKCSCICDCDCIVFPMNEVSNQFTILLFHINIDKQKAKHRVCRWADCWVPIGEGDY